MNPLYQIYGSLTYFVSQTFTFVFDLIIAYVIWLVGKYLIDLAEKLIRKADISKWKLDNAIVETLINIGRPTAKVVLVLVILDFLGVGSTIVGAIAQGITFTIAITLGLAFGDALKPEARNIVEFVKNKTELVKE